MIKTSVKRDKEGKLLELVLDGDIDEYIAYDEEMEGDPYL